MNTLKIANQTVVFLIELVMLGSLAYFGFQKGDAPWMKYGLAVLLPVVGIILWGFWAAPKSAHRLEMPYLAAFRTFMFLIAAFLLYKCGQTKSAISLAVISVVTQVASIFLEGND